ncbi:GerAB/ArcD/ProY family transporter [Metabacillus malikii]|uniref:Spore germination protein (Amino acid permease) n=1 Tax=Metabacillus malikii TaxID=1504265 RepID=A0ABT9ZK40_9BACI|nr:GerAB/ArcD/ProY family transporter [Metabacillus malikii]MDQ0232661.1 spore germination protein (amino acid permease) [Metabacillus malikii]
MKSIVKENKMVSPYFLFFLIHSTQTGVAVLSFQVNIIGGAGQDAWISVFATGLFMHVILFMMLYILKHSSTGDILSLHREVFGKYLGGLISITIAIYLALISLNSLHTYIDLLQIWVFDGIASWEFSLLFCVLIYYVVSGGFRIITAIAYWGVVIPSFLLLSILYLLNYAEISYLTPIFNYHLNDYLISAKEVLPVYMGFESVLIFYPFISERETSHKWGHIATLYTTLLYTVIAVITFLFFTQGKLEHLTWPTLTLIKIIQLPFLERFEFIFIFTWLLVVMPVVCINLWAAVRSFKLTIPKLKSTYILIAFLTVFHIVNSLFIEIGFSHLLDKVVTTCGITFIFCYIPIIFLITVIRKKWKQRDGSSASMD